jgi:NRPS condensation-like uncharacterized protein
MQNTLPRALDPGEAFFFMSDHVSCMNFVVFAERAGHLNPARIQAALDVIQQENLLLQARICWTEAHGLRFEHAPGKPIALHCRSATSDDWQSWIEQELSQPFAEAAAPLVRCLYLEIAAPARSVLGLSFHHSIADGRSGNELLSRLLSLMSGSTPIPSATSAAALPAMADLHPPHFRWAEQPQAAKQLRNSLLNDYRRHGALADLPWLATQASGRTPRFIRQRFDADVTLALISGARVQGTSVHGLLCATQLLAQLALQPDSGPATFFLSCPVDMRPYLEPAQPATPTGFLTSLISNSFSISQTSDVWALARDIISQTRLQIARGEGHLLYSLYGLDGAPVKPDRLEPFKKKVLAAMPNTMISNVGAIKTVADDPAVDAMSFALCPMPYQTLFTAASCYQDQLILNIGFDAARLTEANAQVLVQRIRALLLAAADTASNPA